MILIADPDRKFRTKVTRALNERHEVIEIDGPGEAQSLIEQQHPSASVLLLGPGTGLEESLRTADSLNKTAPHLSVILVSDGLDGSALSKALPTGVRAVVPTRFEPAQLNAAIENAESDSTNGQQPSNDIEGSRGLLTTVFSAKGGCGKSFLALNLSILLAQRTGQRVALVDLDVEFGDLAIMTQSFPAYTIYDAAQDVDRLDAEALQGYLTSHASGISILAAPSDPSLAEMISPEAVRRILAMLKLKYDYVLVDTPSSFTEGVLSAFDESDRCVLVASMDVPSLKNLKISMQTLDLLGFDRDRLMLVLNRADSKVGLRVQDVEKSISTAVDVAIPSSIEVPLSINYGTPLVLRKPKSAVATSVAKLVPQIESAHASLTGATSTKKKGRRVHGTL